MDDCNKDLGIADILARRELGEITDAERRTLDAWLAESARNREFYEMITGVESLRRFEASVGETDFDRIAAGTRRKIATKIRRRFVARAASAAAVLVVGVFSAYLLFDRQSVQPDNNIAAGTVRAVMSLPDGRRVELSAVEQETAWRQYLNTESCEIELGNIHVEVPRGGEYKLTLDDGTTVWLNAGSYIEYPRKFAGGKRSVFLSGEAFFDVVRDADMPFEITTPDDLTVTVLGTRFNVHSYDDVPDVLVTLLDGSVAVCNDVECVTLAPNQQAVFNRTTGALTVHDAPNAAAYAAWINGQFDFSAVTLDVIFDAMEKWYNVDMYYHNVDIRAMGVFTIRADRSENISDILGVLGNITGIKYRIENRIVHLSF